MAMGERISTMRRVLEKHGGGKVYTDELYGGRNALPEVLLKSVEKEALIETHGDLRRKFESSGDAEKFFSGPHAISADKAVAPVFTLKDSENPKDVGESLISYAEYIAHESALRTFSDSLLRANREIQSLIDKGVTKKEAEDRVTQMYEKIVTHKAKRAQEQGMITADQLNWLEEFIALPVKFPRSTGRERNDPGVERQGNEQPSDAKMQAALEHVRHGEVLAGTSIPNLGKKRDGLNQII
jgi:hypothetical protein